MNSDEEHLRHQIRQLHEAIVAVENRNNGTVGIEPNELMNLIESQTDGRPVHPRLLRMLQGHANIDSLKVGLERLENDLDSLQSDLHSEPINEIDEHRVD